MTALADEEMVKIMNCVMYNSKSFNDIVLENTRTTMFRKIKWLLNQHMLIVDKIIITEAGNLYHSTLKAISVRYENKAVSVEAEQNFDIVKKWIEKSLDFS